jgi:excinuclease ABC subunit C
MFDRKGQLIYIGKAKCLRSRLLSYFRPHSRDPKAGRIIQHAAAIAYEPAPSEFAALLRELELIRRRRPRFNVVGVPGRLRFCYVCIGHQPAPYVYATRQPTGRELACFGPVPGLAGVSEAVRRLNDAFGLRDCAKNQAMHFADQGELFPHPRTPGCLRAEIGTCCGPCAGRCTQSEYTQRTRQAHAFLDGSDTTLLVQLAEEMESAARAMEYERAASLRDKLAAIRRLADHLGWLRQARQQHSFIYPLGGHDGIELWYFISRGLIRRVMRAPGCPTSARRVAESIRAIYRPERSPAAVVPVNQLDGILLVASWFRRHAAERAKLLTPEEALARCHALATAIAP